MVEKDRFIQSLRSEKEGLRQQIATLRQQVQRNAPQLYSPNSPTRVSSGRSHEKKSLSTCIRFLVLEPGGLLWRAHFEDNE